MKEDTMILYVLRHAEAIAANDDLPDEWRYLTEEGVKSVAKVAQEMAANCRMPRLIVSSPLVRAVQTAQIAASYAGRKNKMVVTPLLQAHSDLGKLRDFLLAHAEEKRVMVVGHQPLLGELVASLLHREEVFPSEKGSCVALEIDTKEPEKQAKFLFYLTPGRKPATSLKKAFPAPKKSEGELPGAADAAV
jgi:phosphohistidine phosphatase